MTGPENKRKRKKFYELLSKLKKAQLEPDKFTVDPVKLAEKRRIDKERRANKKLVKKQQLIKEIKSEKKKLSKKKCLICRQLGHIAADCEQYKQDVNQNEDTQNNNDENKIHGNLLCYYCGSNKHRLSECTKKKLAEKDGEVNELPYATCYICKQQGHISRDCLQNEKGIYVKGGSCHFCQSVRHLAKDCPKNPQKELNKQRKIKKRILKQQIKSQQNDLNDNEELEYLDNDNDYQQDLEEEPEF